LSEIFKIFSFWAKVLIKEKFKMRNGRLWRQRQGQGALRTRPKIIK